MPLSKKRVSQVLILRATPQEKVMERRTMRVTRVMLESRTMLEGFKDKRQRARRRRTRRRSELA